MKIRDVLRLKGGDVVTVGPESTVLAAMRVLVAHNIGSVVVGEGDRIAGILTERDVLRLGAHDPALLSETTVGDAMTTDLVVGVPEDDLDYVMQVMTSNRIRHLPIVADGKLRGMVSIGDVVNAMRKTVEAENRYLRDYIQGVAQ
jgi:CBS domain-containing protein